MFNLRSKKRSLLPACLLVLALAATTHPQKPETDDISVDSSIVLMNAAITSPDGSLTSALGVSDFQVFEDGVEQTIEFVESEEAPFAAVILLDVSGSMKQRVSIARSAAIRFLDGIRLADQVAIYSFHRKAELIQDFSNSKDLRSRFFDLKATGKTALNDAVFTAAGVLKARNERRKAIVVLSDGEDTGSKVSASKALKAAQEADATIYTVDMSIVSPSRGRRLQNQAVLKKYASRTGGTFVDSPGGRQLREAFAGFVSDLGRQYTVGYYSTNQKPDGKWRSVELKTLDSTLAIRTRDGYYAQKK